MKKRLFLLPVLLFLCAWVLYHSVGWFDGDPLTYIRENYAYNGSAVVSCDYVAAGEDDRGGFLLYAVTTADGTEHTIRLDVVFHRYLTKTGPDYKIKGLREVFDDAGMEILPKKALDSHPAL